MKKKTYIIPTVTVVQVPLHLLVIASANGVHITTCDDTYSDDPDDPND